MRSSDLVGLHFTIIYDALKAMVDRSALPASFCELLDEAVPGSALRYLDFFECFCRAGEACQCCSGSAFGASTSSSSASYNAALPADQLNPAVSSITMQVARERTQLQAWYMVHQWVTDSKNHKPWNKPRKRE